jgi:hypothetical protein
MCHAASRIRLEPSLSSSVTSSFDVSVASRAWDVGDALQLEGSDALIAYDERSTFQAPPHRPRVRAGGLPE